MQLNLVSAPDLCPSCGAYWDCDCKREAFLSHDLDLGTSDAKAEPWWYADYDPQETQP